MPNTNSEDGVSLTADGESEGASPSSLTWEEVWGRIGLAADAEISTVQAELIVEAYPVDKSIGAAVDDGVLAETFFQAPASGGGSERHHGGYRLVGEPVVESGGRGGVTSRTRGVGDAE